MADLESKYRDRVTGFEGTATARTEFLDDAPSVRLTRASKSGLPEDVWFPEGRLDQVGHQPLGFEAAPGPDVSAPWTMR